jgi:uncharacterized protein (DUF849 family)
MSAGIGGTIVIAAPNGARRTKVDHPNLPMTADETAAEARRCRDAGASVLHLHVRDADGGHSLDVGRYREAIAAVRDAVGDDMVIQATTEAVGMYSAEEQIRMVRSLKPEAISVAVREIVPDAADEAGARDFFGWLMDAEVWAQLILYDPADIERFIALHEAGLFAVSKPSVLLVLGRYTVGQRSEPSDIDPMLAALSPIRDDVSWSVCAFGAQENACMRHALGEGGHVRVGFENNLLLPDGERADYTADLVRLAADAARDAGRPPLDAAAVRALVKGWA